MTLVGWGRSAPSSPLFVILYINNTIEAQPGEFEMPTFVHHLTCPMQQSATRRLRFLSVSFSIAACLSAVAPSLARVKADDGILTSEADDHLVRRCEPGPKEEHCYWVEVGAASSSRR